MTTHKHKHRYFDIDNYVFWVKMSGGGGPLEIRTENAIQVSSTLAMSIDDFFDTRT